VRFTGIDIGSGFYVYHAGGNVVFAKSGSDNGYTNVSDVEPFSDFADLAVFHDGAIWKLRLLALHFGKKSVGPLRAHDAALSNKSGNHACAKNPLLIFTNVAGNVNRNPWQVLREGGRGEKHE
jgi:hypothetical protein